MATGKQRAKPTTEERTRANLRKRWNEGLRGYSTWESFEAFAAWAAATRARKGQHLAKHDESKPHGPENSYWMEPMKLRPRERPDSPFCFGCAKECPGHGGGCEAWREYFVRNWNRNIYRGKRYDG